MVKKKKKKITFYNELTVPLKLRFISLLWMHVRVFQVLYKKCQDTSRLAASGEMDHKIHGSDQIIYGFW